MSRRKLEKLECTSEIYLFSFVFSLFCEPSGCILSIDKSEPKFKCQKGGLMRKT